MDPTLLTILLLLVLATAIALVQARKRDPCLTDFADFHVTLAEKGGDLSWGKAEVYPTGLEITYVEPIVAREGHQERSFIFYKEQYGAMEALYRYADGLTDEERMRRRRIIKETAQPGLVRRIRRQLRNWIGMVRDALVQASSVVIGAAKTQAPGSAVLGSQEQQLKALSTEIIGHAGNAFDPLLERHLFSQVVVEVTSSGKTRNYCGWLKDYSSQFIEVVDAVANPTGTSESSEAYAPGDTRLDGLTLRIEARRLHIVNESAHMLHIDRVTAGAWMRPMGTVLPPGYNANLTLPPNIDPGEVQVHLSTADRVDMVVPRTHALVRHAGRQASGSAGQASNRRSATRARSKKKKATESDPQQISARDIFARKEDGGQDN